MDGGVWIDTPTKRALLFVGQLVWWMGDIHTYSTGDNKDHFWYGSMRSCGATADNGLIGGDTGPEAETVANYLWFFSPSDIQAVLLKQKPANWGSGGAGPMPVSESLLSGFTATGGVQIPRQRAALRQFPSAWFDSKSGLLFISQAEGGPAPTYQAYVHVWQLHQ
jgi:hypothetical protein